MMSCSTLPSCPCITRPEQLAPYLSKKTINVITEVHRRYPMRISGYYFSLLQQSGDALAKQVIPDIRELSDPEGLEDPLDEENLSPVPNLVHKYPDSALFLVSSECAMYCRFCTRKRKVGTAAMQITDETIAQGIAYLQNTPAIKDVLISGGDPFMLSDNRLEKILHAVRAIPSVSIIRLGTRIPCSLPARITVELAEMLKKFHPLYINTHFNHPAEITPQAARACEILADAGIPLGCQTVLLKGINDSPEIIKALMYRLLQIRVKPYYLFQADLTRGTAHFRTTIQTGQQIMRSLIGHISGLAIPTYALDSPDGGGKIPLTPEYVHSMGKTLEFTTCTGQLSSYPNQA